MASEYEQYIRTEWKLFVEDPRRTQISLDVLASKPIKRVLDVGCGAGQELLPFAKDALCVGVDVSPEAAVVGRRIFGEMNRAHRVIFVQGTAEALPFHADTFDAVICRLALPYTDNARALAEVARVLRSDGSFLLKIHHARYYLHKLWSGLKVLDVMSMIHAARVFVSGLIYHATGKQVRTRLISQETFQTEWMLRRELARCGLSIGFEVSDSNPLTPVFLIKPCQPPREA
jgi:SAM-dependent methyltransferase